MSSKDTDALGDEGVTAGGGHPLSHNGPVTRPDDLCWGMLG
ncbi:hypothetical protein [Streptomyces sp. NPDC048603]